MRRFIGLVTMLVCGAVSAANAVPPVLTLTDPAFGTWVYSGTVAPAVTIHEPLVDENGVTVDLSWSAVPGEPGRTIDAYRYVLDEQYGAEWTAWGNLQGDTHAFYFGLHTYQVEVRDNMGEITHGTLIVAIDTPVLDVSCEWGVFEFKETDNPAVEVTAVRDEVNPALVSFSWQATPGSPFTSIVDYRYGWDLTDPNDDGDPAWTAWGSTLSTSRSFYTGVHTFYVETRDSAGTVTRGGFSITVEIGPVRAQQTTWGAMKAKYTH